MEADFWHNKWARNEIGFHREDANPLLTNHFARLALPTGSRVFLPLCGKTRDIAWLLDQGYRVAGAELSRLAVSQLFAELGAEPVIAQQGKLEHFSAPGIDIFAGDLFALTPAQLGTVDAVYDRAALVALPPAMRNAYCPHVLALSAGAPQLLVTYEYAQDIVAGPPFSIPTTEVAQHYADSHLLQLLGSAEVEGGMKGRCPATEHVWHLAPKA